MPETGGGSAIAALTSGDKPAVQVTFPEKQSSLPDEAKAALEKLAAQVSDVPTARLQLKAYAGGEDLQANRARRLSLSRALSVRSFLMANGIRSTRIDVRALGNKADGEPLNRVDVVVTDP